MRAHVLQYQFINYNSIYGTGGTLCYRVEPCVSMVAIQNTCGTSCCQNGPEGEAVFANATSHHNYDSNNGPGPWLVAQLTEFDDTLKVNYGAGLWDVFPCPRTSNLDPTNPNMCDPSTCTSAPFYPDETYWLYWIESTCVPHSLGGHVNS